LPFLDDWNEAEQIPSMTAEPHAIEEVDKGDWKENKLKSRNTYLSVNVHALTCLNMFKHT
jgi:hypothetical protein